MAGGKRRLARTQLLLAGCSVIWSVPALAEDGADGSAPIIVTAERREVSINDVGISMQAFGADELADSRVDAIADLSQITANTNFRETRPGGNPVITIRGIGTNDFLVSSNTSTAVYMDGVYSPNIGTISGQLFDLERVEVLKGPQSALYGRNATAGAVNVISAKPTDYLTGYVRGTFGNYESITGEAAISGPIGEGVSGRLSVRTDHRYDGYMENLFPGGEDIGTVHKTAVRAQLLAQPSDSFTVHAIFGYENEDSVPGAWTSFGRREPGGDPGPPYTPFCATDVAGMRDDANLCASSFGYQRQTSDFYTLSENDPWDTKGDVYTATLMMQYEADSFSVTSTTGYIDWSQFRYQSDGIPFTEVLASRDQSTWQLSEDLQLASTGSSPLQWLGGVYLSTGNVTLFRYAISGLFNSNTIITHDADTDTIQPYVQLNYEVSPTIELTAGARYIYEKTSKVGGTYADLNFNEVIDEGDSTSAFIDDSIDQNHLTWKLGINFTPTDATLVYASFAHGYKSGGYSSAFSNSDAQLLPYGGEKIDAYEVGLKQSFGSVAQLNASAFYYDYTDIQTNTAEVIDGIPVNRFDNIPKAEVKGVDVDLTLWPVPGLTLALTGGYLDTSVDSYIASNNALVDQGNRLPNAPKFSGSARARYEASLNDSLKFFISGSISHHSMFFMDVENTPKLAVDTKATIVDASMGLDLNDGELKLTLWSKNLTDEAYNVSSYQNGSLLFATYNMPRTYGLTVAKTF